MPALPWYKCQYQHQRHYKRRKLQTNISYEYRHKILQLDTSKLNPATYKKDYITMNQWNLSNVSLTYRNQLTYHTSRIKDKNYVVMSTDTEKASGKIQHPSMIKITNKLGIKGNFLNLKNSLQGLGWARVSSNIRVVMQTRTSVVTGPPFPPSGCCTTLPPAPLWQCMRLIMEASRGSLARFQEVTWW